jgi:similar to stage IV sporulation protein
VKRPALWRGWLTLNVRSPHPAEVISRLVEGRVRISSVARTPDGIRFEVPLADFPRVRAAVRGRREAVRIERRGGLPIWLAKIRRRPFLLVGVLTAAVLIGYVSPRVWILEVVGVSRATEAQVVAAAALGGLRPGVPRDNLRYRRVEASILARVPGYSWAGLTVRGTLAIIRLHPIKNRPPSPAVHALVASDAGRVVSVAVFTGQPMISVGDHVRRGQLLILGEVEPPAGNARSSATGLRTVAAGQVVALVPIHVEVRQPLQKHYVRPTGRHYEQAWVVINGFGVPVAGLAPVPFSHYDAKTVATPLVWQGVELPGQVLRVIYNETIAGTLRMTAGQARNEALETARRALDHLAGDTRVIDPKFTVKVARQAATVTATAAFVKNIAVPRREVHTKGGT